MNASDSETDHKGLNDAMIEESDGSDTSEVDDLPIFSKCKPTYTCMSPLIAHMYLHVDDHLPTNATPIEALGAGKVIVSVPQLLQLVRICLHEHCSKMATTMQRFVGATLVMTITCS